MKEEFRIFSVLLMDQVWLCFQVATFIPREKEGKKKRGNRSFRTEWHLVWSTYISDEKPVKDMCIIDYIWYIYIYIHIYLYIYVSVLHYVYIYIYHTCLPLYLASKASKMGYKFIWTFFHWKGRSFCWEKQFAFQKVAATFIWNLPFIFNKLVQTKKNSGICLVFLW